MNKTECRRAARPQTLSPFRLLLVALAAWAAVGRCAEGTPGEGKGVSTPEHRALVAQISPGHYRRGKDTPAEFVTSQLAHFHPVVRAIHWLLPERMRRDYFDFGANDVAARELIERFRADAERGWAWKAPRREIALPFLPRLAEREADWEKALTFRGEIPLDRDDLAPSGETVWRVAHDGEYFRWRVDVRDADLRYARPRPYKADSIECFIKSDPRLGQYWEVVVGPDGALFTASHQLSRESGLRSTEQWIAPERLAVSGAPIPGGYRVEGAFPFCALARTDGSLPFAGARLEFMLVRTDAKGDDVAKSAPTPLLYDGHNVFGYLTAILEDAPPSPKQP